VSIRVNPWLEKNSFARQVRQRRKREIFVEPKTQNKSSSVGAAYSDVAPTELIYFRNYSTTMPRPRRWTKSGFAALTPNRIALNFPG
jgi:hypothetical protein